LRDVVAGEDSSAAFADKDMLRKIKNEVMKRYHPDKRMGNAAPDVERATDICAMANRVYEGLITD